MADTTISTPPSFSLASWAAAALGLLSAITVVAELPKSDHLRTDVGLDKIEPRPPLSQDAATALHLQSLGKWY